MRTPSSLFGVTVPLLLALAAGCAARGKASASATSDATLAADADTDPDGKASSEATPVKPREAGPHAASQAHGGAGGAAAKEEPLAKPPEVPRYDPKIVREALDRTATPVDEQRPRLGLRLAVVDRGPNAPWLLAIVNRGTEPVRVVPDLRTLQLEVTPPPPPVDETKPARPQRAPKPVTCALPRELVPQEENTRLTQVLAPGEGLVDSFDPRLYCLPTQGKSPLVPEASVVVRLGWPEKTKPVWRKGKKELIVLEQTAPFLAHRDVPEGSLPEAPDAEPKAQEKPEPGEPPRSDSDAIKLLLAPEVSLGAGYGVEPPPDNESLGLQLARGSDARTEMEATVTVSLVNRSKKKERIFFRRELVSYEVSGPQGIVACQPGPDQRVPDRGSIATLRPGGRISATSRLIELCPEGTLRIPGLYLVHARFDSIDERDPNAPPMFSGRLVSHKPVAIRVRRGWGELPAQREPERVQIGTP